MNSRGKEATPLRLALMTAGALAALLTGCGGSAPGLKSPKPPMPASPAVGDAPALPLPSVLRSSSGEVVSDSYRLGREFETEWASRRAYTYAYSDYVNFAGVAGGGQLAFAGYRLTVPGSAYDNTVRVVSDDELADGQLWLGLADFTRDSWFWQQLDGSGIAQLEPSLHLKAGEACAFLVYSGSAYLKVDAIQLGALSPPFITDVLPRIGVTGQARQFSVATKLGGEAGSCVWDFGAAAVPSVSSQLKPTVQLQDLGLYNCSVTATNAAGSYAEDFTLWVVGDAEYLPQTLYAIPLASSAHVGDTVTVQVVTGALPPSVPLSAMPSVGVTVAAGCEYVPDSFNIGAPGGADYVADGIWSTLNPPATDFIRIDDDFFAPVPTDVPGQQLLTFSVAPVNGGTTTQAGALFNFQLKFNAAGTYRLGFREHYVYNRTFYADEVQQSRPWYDISNDHPNCACEIVVTE